MQHLDCRGLACPGPVIRVKKALEMADGKMITVFVDNEANTAALGYYNYADRAKADNLAYLSIGVGMAAGLVL